MTNNNRIDSIVNKHKIEGIYLRYQVCDKDDEQVRKLAEITGFFNKAEIAIAQELVKEALIKGTESDYCFIFAEKNNQLIGYSCYGLIPCTVSSFDLYWIAVHPDFQGKGLGKLLLKDTESLVYKAGGRRIYVETSYKSQYESTRAFYEKCGYKLLSLLEDFYADGDSKATYCKIL